MKLLVSQGSCLGIECTFSKLKEVKADLVVLKYCNYL